MNKSKYTLLMILLGDVGELDTLSILKKISIKKTAAPGIFSTGVEIPS